MASVLRFVSTGARLPFSGAGRAFAAPLYTPQSKTSAVIFTRSFAVAANPNKVCAPNQSLFF